MVDKEIMKKVVERLAKRKNLFDILPPLDERIISFYISGLDLSKQNGFLIHKVALENYLVTITAELAFFTDRDCTTNNSLPLIWGSGAGCDHLRHPKEFKFCTTLKNVHLQKA